MDTSTYLGSLQLKNCIMNSSCCQIPSEVKDAGAIVCKTMTLRPNKGNRFPRYYYNSSIGIAINSIGLSNPGVNSVRLPVSEVPIIYSIGPENIGQMIYRVQGDIIEINMSCPNVRGVEIVGYDFKLFEKLLRRVFHSGRTINKIVGLKLPPYFSKSDIRRVAHIIRDFPQINYIVCSNTIPNGLVVDVATESTKILATDGYGGISGPLVKPIALSNVRQFRQFLQDRVSIVGCGGINTGSDVFEYILCGADGVQVGTTFIEEGPSCISRITEEFKEICDAKGYKKITDFRGKLKIHSKL